MHHHHGVKTSDIPDTTMLAVVAVVGEAWAREWGSRPDSPRWADRWTVTGVLAMPEKVVLSKAKRLMKRGLMDGCPCGCRGDFEITPAGLALLAEATPPA
jgi:hypothetical protein